MSEQTSEHKRRIEEEAGLPPGFLDEPLVIEPEPQAEPAQSSWVSHLRKTKSWNELQEELLDEAAGYVRTLMNTHQQTHEKLEDYMVRQERLKGVIWGLLRVLDAPAVAQRAIEQQLGPRQ